MKRKSFIALLMVLLLVFVSACNKTDNKEAENKANEAPQTESESKEEKAEVRNEIRYAIWNTPSGIFMPLLQDVQQDGYVNSVVYNGLLSLNNKHDLEPALAKSYELSEDGLRLSFELRDDVKWQDGEAFTADDVKFTLESMAHKDYTGELYSLVESIKGAKDFHEGKADTIEGIKIDGNKIDIEFDQIYAPALNNIGTAAIIPKHIWEKVEVKDWEKQTDMLNNPIGTGPFMVKEFKAGEYVKLDRFDDYFEGTPKMPAFEFVVLNPDTAIAEILNGAVDVAEISSFDKDDFKKLEESGIKTVHYPTPNIQYMGMNNKNPTLSDVKIRQAIAYGVDRKGIVDNLLDGHGVVINAPMVPSLPSYPQEGLTNYERDVDKAKALIEEAGYTLGSDGIYEKDGQRLSFSLVVPLGNKNREKTGPIIQSQLKDIGIEISIEQMEFPQVMEKVVKNRDYDTYLMANTLGLDPDPKPNWYSNSDWNFVGFENAESDKLIDEGLKAKDNNERIEIYHKWGKILNENVPWLPLYAPDIINAYNTNLKNYEPNTFCDFYNVANWDLN